MSFGQIRNRTTIKLVRINFLRNTYRGKKKKENNFN